MDGSRPWGRLWSRIRPFCRPSAQKYENLFKRMLNDVRDDERNLFHSSAIRNVHSLESPRGSSSHKTKERWWRGESQREISQTANEVLREDPTHDKYPHTLREGLLTFPLILIHPPLLPSASSYLPKWGEDRWKGSQLNTDEGYVTLDAHHVWNLPRLLPPTTSRVGFVTKDEREGITRKYDKRLSSFHVLPMERGIFYCHTWCIMNVSPQLYDHPHIYLSNYIILISSNTFQGGNCLRTNPLTLSGHLS